jgi:hypothetical protein
MTKQIDPAKGAKRDRPEHNELRDALLRYLRAWDDVITLGETEFDECVNLPEFADFLAGKLLQLRAP